MKCFYSADDMVVKAAMNDFLAFLRQHTDTRTNAVQGSGATHLLYVCAPSVLLWFVCVDTSYMSMCTCRRASITIAVFTSWFVCSVVASYPSPPHTQLCPAAVHDEGIHGTV